MRVFGAMRHTISALLCGALAALPAVASGQEKDLARVAVVTGLVNGHPLAAASMETLRRGLAERGWTEGENLEIVACWEANEKDRASDCAEQVVAAEPDVILAAATPAALAIQRTAGSIPIVFVSVADPVGSGLVDSLARPGGNVTGFLAFEYALGGKLLELLTEIAPQFRRVAVLVDRSVPSGRGQLDAILAAAGQLAIEVVPIDLRDPAAIERGIADVSRESGGLILTAHPLASANRDLVIALAAKHRVPAAYVYRHFAEAGGLVAYGPDLVDPFYRASDYIARILDGADPAGLPVQGPTKYALVVNTATAGELELELPQSILIRADDIIE